MAPTDSVRRAALGFMRLSVPKKALLAALTVLALTAVTFWFAGAGTDPAVDADSAWTSAQDSAETSGSASAAATQTSAPQPETAATEKSDSTGDDPASAQKAATNPESPATPRPAPSKKPETELTDATVGLTAAQRKTIALEIIAFEEKATEEANAKYPTDIAANEQYWGELDAKYKADLAVKYEISLDQLLFIMVVDVPQYLE